jgi:C4-dicarboxylate-specific signal transduction histidine kinase
MTLLRTVKQRAYKLLPVIYILITILWAAGIVAVSGQMKRRGMIDSVWNAVSDMRGIVSQNEEVVVSDDLASERRAQMVAQAVAVRRNLYIGITGFLLVLAGILLYWDTWVWNRRREAQYWEKQVARRTRDLEAWVKRLEHEATVRKQWEQRLDSKIHEGIGRLEALNQMLHHSPYTHTIQQKLKELKDG